MNPASITLDADNPLLDFSGLPRFADFRIEQVAPAIEALLAAAREALETVCGTDAAPAWDTIVTPLEHATERLSRAWGMVSHLNAVADSPELREAYNALLPAVWDFRIGIHFAHRVMAVILAVALTWFAWTIRRDPASGPAMRAGAAALVTLLVLQILLGAMVIWTLRRPEMTTAHVVIGALTLAVTFWLTWVAHRDQLDGPAPLATPSRG